MIESNDTPAVELTPLQKAEAKRAARKVELKALYDAQRAIDIEALFEIETELGEANVSYVDVPHTPGMVTLSAVRCPAKLEFKRYQDRIKNNPKDTSGPAEELGSTCLVYPKGDARDALLAARPGLLVEQGVLAMTLSTGRIADEGKA
jgi:hypothetical protein